MSDNTVEVKFSADASGLTEGTEEASEAVSSAVAAMTAQFAALADGTAESMGAMIESVKAGAASVTEQLEVMNAGIEKVSKTFALLGTVMVGGVIGEKLVELAKASGEYAESIEHASSATGASTDALQGLKFAAEVSNVSFDQLQRSLILLSKNLATAGDGSKATGAAFQAFGLNAKDLTTLPLDQVILKLADAFHNSEDSSQKAAAAMAIFGRGGKDMIPFLDLGASAIEKLMQQASDMGLVLSGPTLKALDSMNVQMKTLHAAAGGLTIQLSQALLPGLSAMATEMIEDVTKGGPLKTMFDDVTDAVKGTVNAVTYVAEAFQIVGEVIGAQVARISNNLSQLDHFMRTATLDPSISKENDRILTDLYDHIDSVKTEYGKMREALADPAKVAAPEMPGAGNQISFNPKGPGKEKADPSEMAALQDELAQEKLVYQQENDLRQMSLADIAQYWADIKAQGGLSAKDSIAVDRMVAESGIAVNKEALAQRIALATEEIDAKEKLGLQEITDGETHQKALFDQGKISADQLLNIDLNYEAQRLKIQEQALQARLAMLQADPSSNPAALQKIRDQMLTVEQQYTAKVQSLHDAAAKADDKTWDNAAKSMVDTFGSAFKGIVTGTETMQKAMQQVAEGILNIFVNIGEQMAENWVKTTLLNNSTSATGALQSVIDNAAVAGSAAFAAIAGIPIIGPGLAPAAGAEAQTAALAFGAGIAAEGGYDIPAGINPITQLHQREMVLPAEHADTIRSLAGGSGMPAIHVHGAPTDTITVAQLQALVSQMKRSNHWPKR